MRYGRRFDAEHDEWDDPGQSDRRKHGTRRSDRGHFHWRHFRPDPYGRDPHDDRDNTSQDGGGVYLQSAIVNFSDSLIANNVATRDGGGIYTTSVNAFSLTNTTVSGNTATANGGGLRLGSAMRRS